MDPFHQILSIQSRIEMLRDLLGTLENVEQVILKSTSRPMKRTAQELLIQIMIQHGKVSEELSELTELLSSMNKRNITPIRLEKEEIHPAELIAREFM